MTLLTLATKAGDADPSVKLKIGQAGAIAPLVDFLRSRREDRIQIGVAALESLTDGCSENAILAYEAGALDALLSHMESSTARIRTAAATASRNICMENDEFRKKF